MTDIPTRETIVQLLRTGAPLSDVVRAYLLGWLEVERIREINKDVRFQMQPRESGSRPTRDRPWLRGICRRSQYRMTMTNPKTHGAMKRTSWLLLLLAISLLLLLGVAFGSAEELNV